MFLFTFLLIFAGYTPSAHASVQTFGLKQALEYGVRHSPGLDSSARQKIIAEAERKNAFAKFLPTIDLATANGIQKSDPSTRTEPWYGEVTANLNENLYDNGESITNYKIAKLNEEFADINFEKTRDQFLLDTARSFYNYAVAKELFKIQNEQLQLLRKQYHSVERDYRQGLKLRRDFLRFRTQVSRAEIDTLTAKSEVDKEAADLFRRLGTPEEDWHKISFRVPPLPTKGALPEDRIYPPLNINSHYDARLAGLEAQVSSKQVDLATRKIWPEISFNTGALYSNLDYYAPRRNLYNGDSVAWHALITVSYNLLDWGTRSRNRGEARERQQIAENSQRDAVLAVNAAEQQLVIDLEKLRQNYRSARDLMNLEQGNTQYMEREYRQGQISYLDLINAYQDLASAQRTYVSAVYDLKRAALEYRYHEGTLYESFF